MKKWNVLSVSIFETSGLQIQAGETLFTRMRSLLMSRAIVLVKILIAPLEAE